MHVTIPKDKRRQVDSTLLRLFPYIDADDAYAMELKEAWLEIDSRRYNCVLNWRNVEAICGDVRLAYLPKGRLNIRNPQPAKDYGPDANTINPAFPFDFAEQNGKAYMAASSYALHPRFNAFNYNPNDSSWIDPSRSSSVQKCATKKEIRGDSRFSYAIRERGSYSWLNGEIPCLENVSCTSTSSTTRLSVAMYLIPIDYRKTILAMSYAVNGNNPIDK